MSKQAATLTIAQDAYTSSQQTYIFLLCAPAAQLRRFPILVHHVRIGTFTD